MNLTKMYWLARNYFSSKPFYLICFVTARCNLKCAMCFYWKNTEAAKKENELTAEEFERIAANFQHIQQVSIGGGEPFLRDDLPEICGAFSKISNAQIITIPTNGSLPEKIQKDVKRMVEDCPKTFFRIFLSIDGIGEKHDKIRGVKGSFEKLMQTYSLLDALRSKHKNLGIDAGTVLSAYNQNNIKDVFEFVEKNMGINNHQLLLARGNTRNTEAKNIQLEKYGEMIKWLAEKKAKKEKRPFSSILRAIFSINMEKILETAKDGKSKVPCVAGKKLVVISETGDVYPCEILSRKFGNIRENNFDLQKILDSNEAKKTIKNIKSGNCACTFECAMNASIAFCPKMYPLILKRALSEKCKTALGPKNAI